MPAFVTSPRRSPRVPVHLKAAMAWGSATWSVTTLDLSATGCALVSERPLAKGTVVALMLRRDGPGPALSVEGEVVWVRGSRLAVRFQRPLSAARPDQWFADLLSAEPGLSGCGNRLPARLPLDATLTVRPAALAGPVHDIDEARLLRAITNGGAIGLAALHSRLPPDRFARALYALIGKGAVTTSAIERLAPVPTTGPGGSLEALAKELFRREGWSPGGPVRPAPSSRGAMRSERLAADLAAGTRDE